MRRRRLLALLLPGPLLVAAFIALRRHESPAASDGAAPSVAAIDAVPAHLRPSLYGLGDTQLEALRPWIERSERLKSRLDWSYNAYAWMRVRRSTLDVLGCVEPGPTPLTSRPVEKRWVPPDALSPPDLETCPPSCAPPDEWRFNASTCPPPRGWASLHAPILPPRPPPRNLHGPRTAFHGTRLAEEVDRSGRALVAMDDVLARPARDPTGLLACTADAAGITLEHAHAGTLLRFPDLRSDVPLRRLPVAVRVVGPRLAVATWVHRLSRRSDLWSVEHATLESLPGEGDLVALEAELEAFVRD